MDKNYTLYVWRSNLNGSCYFCYDLLNNKTNQIECGGGCVDPQMLAAEINKDFLVSKGYLRNNEDIKYVNSPSPSSFSFDDSELSYRTKGLLEKILEIDISSPFLY